MLIRLCVTALAATAIAASPAQAPRPGIDDSATYYGNIYELQTPTRSKAYVKEAARSAGYSRTQWKCLSEILWRESRWDWQADNPNSSAFGLFQQLKLDPKTDLATQVERGLKYITHRYGTACRALDFHDKNGWY